MLTNHRIEKLQEKLREEKLDGAVYATSASLQYLLDDTTYPWQRTPETGFYVFPGTPMYSTERSYFQAKPDVLLFVPREGAATVLATYERARTMPNTPVDISCYYVMLAANLVDVVRGCKRLGVGLCAFKTTDQKAEAAAVFLRWLTEQQRNLEFAADTGYMPVSSAAFDAIADYPFEQQSYQRLYDVYNEMRIQNTPLSEPGIVGYHAKAKTLYDSLRQRQKDYPQRLADGETLEALAEETWQLLCDNA